MARCCIPHAMSQLESDDKQSPHPLSSKALPLPCHGPWRDITGCLCKKQRVSAVCSHQSQCVPAESPGAHVASHPAAGTAQPSHATARAAGHTVAHAAPCLGHRMTEVTRQSRYENWHRTGSAGNNPAPPTHPAKSLVTTQAGVICPTETETS